MSGGRPPEFVRRVRNRPAVRRRARWLLLAQLLTLPAGVAIGGALAYGAHRFVRDAQAFRVHAVRVDGATAELEAHIAGLLAPLYGRNLLTTDLRPWRERVEALPLVATAHLRRRFPGTLLVTVEAPTPWGTLRVDDGLFAVTADAVLLGRVPAADVAPHHVRVPGARLAVTPVGTRLASAPTGRVFRALPAAVRFFAWLQTHAQALPGPVDSVELAADGLRARLQRPALVIVLGDAARLDEQVEALANWLGTVPPASGAIVDLRFRGMVVVRDPALDELTARRE